MSIHFLLVRHFYGSVKFFVLCSRCYSQCKPDDQILIYLLEALSFLQMSFRLKYFESRKNNGHFEGIWGSDGKQEFILKLFGLHFFFLFSIFFYVFV